MPVDDEPTLRGTGGQIDDMVMAVIDAAFDKDVATRERFSSSLVELGRQQPALVLSCSLLYLYRHPKLVTGHRVQILRAMELITIQSLDSIDTALADDITKLTSAEMTKSKDIQPEWQSAASAVLVAVGTKHCNCVMGDMMLKFQPGILPHFFVVETMGKLATANAFGMVPFLKGVLGTMLPMLGLAKHENMRWVFSTALASFCESILDYLANLEKAPDKAVKKAAFSAELYAAHDVLINVWLNTRETKLRVAVVEAVGQMSHILSRNKLQEQLPKILSSVLAQYKKTQDKYLITKGLCNVLEAATDEGSQMLEPHLDNLYSVLFPQVCQAVDYSIPATVKNHNEVLRCFAVIARIFSDRIVAILLQKLELTSDVTRIGALTVIRHLINSSGPQMEDKHALVISGIKILLYDSNNKVKRVVAQTIIAMAHHGYLCQEGGESMLEFIVRQCAIAPEPHGRRPADLDYVSNDALRSMCENVLHLLATTVEGMEPVLWPHLLEYIDKSSYSVATPILCRTIANLITAIRDNGHHEMLKIDFTKQVNISSPEAIFARLLVLSGGNAKTRGQGASALQAMRALAPTLNEGLLPLLETVIPKLLLKMEDEVELWHQKQWEDLLLKMLSKVLDNLENETWTSALADACAMQFPLYEGSIPDRCFLMKCLGVCLKKCNKKDAINHHLETLFQIVSHDVFAEKEACAVNVGLTAASHLDNVLNRLETTAKPEGNRKSGLFGFLKESMNLGSDLDDKIKATLMLCYGYVTLYAPPELIVSRMEGVIARIIAPQFNNVKDMKLKQCLIRCVDLIGQAMHSSHLHTTHTFSLRPQLLAHMKTYLLSESRFELHSDVRALALDAAANLVKLEPRLTESEKEGILVAAFECTLSLPPGCNMKSSKSEKYEQVMAEEELWGGTNTALKGFVHEVLLQDLTPSGLHSLFTTTLRWMRSSVDHERQRSLVILEEVLQDFLDKVDVPRVGEGFGVLGSMLGALTPRCSDPCLGVRQSAIICLHKVFCIALKFEGKSAEHKDTMVDAVLTLKERLENTEPSTFFSAISDLAKVVSRKTPPDQLTPLLDALVESLLDVHAHSSAGACVVLNSVVKARGSEIHSKIDKVLMSIIETLGGVPPGQTHTGMLRCVRTIASHHLMPTLDTLLKLPLPLSLYVCECWGELGADSQILSSVLEHLLGLLSHGLPYEERPDPRQKDATLHVATLLPTAVICALTEVLRMTEPQSVMQNIYPRILAALLGHTAAMVGARPPQVPKDDQKELKGRPGSAASMRDVDIDVCECGTLAIRQLLSAMGAENLQESLREDDVWLKIMHLENYAHGYEVFTDHLVESHPQYVSRFIPCLVPGLNSMYESQRVMTAAIMGQLVQHSCCGDVSLVEQLVGGLLGRLVDPNQDVRRLCVRGLANISYTPTLLVEKYSTTVVSAMMAGMDDKEDADDEMTLEAMGGLCKVLACVRENDVRAILINITLRMRPCFEKEKCEVREAAFNLFGNLARFGDGPSKEPFLEQIHTNLVSLLLHLGDPEDTVSNACKGCLQQLGPLLSSATVNSMFQKHLLEHGALHYGEFINDLTKAMIQEFPDKLNFYVMNTVTFFKSNDSIIKSNAVILCGFLLGNMNAEQYGSVSKEHVSGALKMLLKDPSPEVRMKTAEAVSLLHHF